MSIQNSNVIVEAPATVSNVACGFDILGYAVDHVGDRIEIKTKDEPGIIISNISGANLSKDIKENIAGVVCSNMLKALDATETGIDISIEKLVLPGSGLGSSASSSVATAVAVNHMFGNPFSQSEILNFAMSGEVIASENFHADNVTPCLLGGFQLIRSYEPLDIISIDYPEDLYTTVIHPQVEVKTSYARSLLGNQVDLKKAITQWGNVAGLMTGLISNDYDLISRSLVDVVAEPVRSPLIPHYDEIKALSVEYGALGANISGSGPSIFILSKGDEKMDQLIKEAIEIYARSEIEVNAFTSKVSRKGAQVIP